MELNNVESQKRNEIERLEKERVAPILKKAEEIKADIYKEVTLRYKESIDALSTHIKEQRMLSDKEKVEQSKSIWHPVGTIVTLYEYSRWSSRECKKTKKTGTVQIFDGTQRLPENLGSYNYPEVGDVVVFHNKKDGTIGVKFDIISKSGQLERYAPMWLAEGESPENNLTKTILSAYND